MSDPVARRINDIQPFHVMALLAKAREMEQKGVDIVHMEIGEPDFDSPTPVINAGIEALKKGETHYTPALGLLELRQAIAGFYKRRYHVDIDPTRVVITPGSSGALQLVMGALINPGQEVLITDPGYPCNRSFVRMVEGAPISFQVSADDNYQPTVEQIRRLTKKTTRALLVTSPGNPTGTCIDRNQLKEIVKVLGHSGMYLISDEVYHGLDYGEPVSTALEFGDNVFVVNSFSKYFGMTGWRLGWLVAPDAFLPAIDKLAQNLFLAASTPAQHAALACFTPETENILQQRKKIYAERRDYLYQALIELGFKIPVKPDGAFYIYADSSALTQDSFRWCEQLLEHAHVAATPGIDFGRYRANHHVRFAYTTDLKRLKMGVDRIKQFLSSGA